MKYTFIGSKIHSQVYPHPEPTSKFVPNWYKEMPRSRHPATFKPMEDITWLEDNTQGLLYGHTMKECVPIRDYLTSGYIIPLWATIKISLNEEGRMNCGWGDGDEEIISFHRPHQTVGCPVHNKNNNSKDVPKLMCPWQFKTPKGYSTFFFSPRYMEGQIEILPAIVDTDSYHEVNFPFLYHGKNGEENTFEKGTPIVQLIPFKREDWKMEMEEGDFVKSRKFIASFMDSAYRKFAHRKKVFK